MSLSKYMSALASLTLLAASCEDPSILPYRAEINVSNGLVLNGLVLNGLVLNGLVLNGLVLNGLVLNGLVLNGLVLNGLVLNGLVLNGTTLDPRNFTIKDSLISVYVPSTRKTMSGLDLKGLTAKISYVDPSTNKTSALSIRIDDASLDTTNKFKDVWLYQVSYKSDNSNSWQSMCQDYSGNPAPLIPIVGSYWDEKTGARIDDPKVLTPACIEGAIGKCVSFGYRLWANSTQCEGSGRSKKCTTVSLKDHHQACTRMLRADYCGDGIPHTYDGTIIDIFDYLSPPVQLQEERWQMEARWNDDGAICLSQRRHPEINFPGCMRQYDKRKPASLVQLPKCQPYATGDERGLVVSTFNAMTNPPGSGK